MVRSGGGGGVLGLFYRMYVIFGMVIRPIFMDFIGPFIPFISYYWMIRK